MIQEFEKMFRDNYNWFLQKVRRATNTIEAEDVLQSACCKALISLHTYDKEKASLKTWFNKVVFNELWKQHNKKKKQLDSFVLYEDSGIVYDNRPQDLENALNLEKDDEKREILTLVFKYGFTYSELEQQGYHKNFIRKTVLSFRKRFLA